jgi:hypothetical protein
MPKSGSDYLGNIIHNIEATILSGQTVSEPIDMSGVTLKTLFLPAAFTGTELKFQISPDGITYYPYKNINDVDVSVTCTQGNAYGFGAIDFFSVEFLKIISNSVESADRSIILMSRGI